MSTSPGTAVVKHPQTKRLRAMGMLEMRVKSRTLQEIADEYRCSIDTVQRHLEWAAREGNILKHEETILERLIPKAIAAYEKALDNNDVFVAKDLLGHLMKLSERVDKRQEHVEELSLNAWLKTRKQTDRGRGGEGDPDSTGSEGGDPGYAARNGDIEVRGYAAAGPAEVGPPVDGELVSTLEPAAGRADDEAVIDAIDTEVVVAP
jgi:DNA-binding CsgD family transcriptional regulator